MGEPQEVQLSIMEADGSKGKLPNGGSGNFPTQPSRIIKSQKGHKRWIRISLYTFLVLLGHSAATLLGRQYYLEGGKSKWIGTLVQLVGFPILLPYYCIPASKHASGDITHNSKQPSASTLAMVYISIGLLLAIDCYLYSVGLWYLPVSTFSLISSSQLAFNAFFSFFLNSLKFTPYIINSLVLLTVSSILLLFQTGSSSESTQVSKNKYAIGFICAVAASAAYGLVLSLTQVAFRKVLKKESFKVILDMTVYQSLVATLATVVGLFASGEFQGLKREMEEYEMGKAGYVLNLSFTAISWQVFNLGSLGLILEVSSLFSNAISVLGLPIVPILAVIIFHDKMHGLKVISLVLALWGFLSYTYQQYLDERKANVEHRNNGDSPNASLSEEDNR